MYQITCDDNLIYDPRDSDYMIGSDAMLELETSTAGSAKFQIFSTHPNYNVMYRRKSIFEITQDSVVLFRGYMQKDAKDFYNTKTIELAGVLSFLNDTLIPPFSFPFDFQNKSDYKSAAASGNVVRYLLKWFLDSHNAKVEPFQQLKLGTVTVKDPNNYIFRYSEDYITTWEAIKTRLFDSSLGGYLVVRYESDGNYVDYLEEFQYTNAQSIEFGENIVDLTEEISADDVYTVILPIGGEVKDTNVSYDDEGNEVVEETTRTVNIDDEPDDSELEISDVVKKGKYVYSKSAVSLYGKIFKKVEFPDVTVASNLVAKAKSELAQKAIKLSDTITVSAVDLHYSDSQISALRINRKTVVTSLPHNLVTSYDLTKASIQLLNPQGTTFVLGRKQLTLSEYNDHRSYENIERIERAEQKISEYEAAVKQIKNQTLLLSTSIINNCEAIISEALKEYVSETEYEKFKETVSTTVKQTADGLSVDFNKQIENVITLNGETVKMINAIHKYIRIIGGELYIGDESSPILLHEKNDAIIMSYNGEEVLLIGVDTSGESYCKFMNARFLKMLRIDNFCFRVKESGNLAFGKVV